MDSLIFSLSSELIILIVDHLLDDYAVSNCDPIACGLEDDTISASHQIIRCIAQVSTFWRCICLGNPLWWSNISIVHPWSLEDVKLRLKRAQQCPIDLRIFGHIGYTTRDRNVSPFTRNDKVACCYPPLPPTLAMYTDLFDVIYPVLERCRVMHIRGVFADENRVLPFSMLKQMVDTPMPVLEDLIWEGELNRFNEELSRPDCEPFFLGAPKLKQLRLIGIDVNRFRFTSSYSFPSMSLTILHLSRGSSSAVQISLALLQAMLSTYPFLSTLAIYDDIISTEGFGNTIPTPCTAPSLRSLYIMGNMLSVSQLLLFLHAPRMMELVIAPAVHTDLEVLLKYDHAINSNQHRTSAADATASTGITSRTDRFPRLTTLTLAPAYPQDMIHTLINASECFPLIERLIVAIPPQGYLDNFLGSFTPAVLARNGAQKIIFPHLRDLALHLDLDSVSTSTRGNIHIHSDGIEPKTPKNPKRPSQLERLSRWFDTVREIRRIRDEQLGVPLDNMFVDEGTFNALNSYTRLRLGMDDAPDERGYSRRELIPVTSKSCSGNSQFCDMPGVKMANLWEDQRRKMLFTPFKDLFLGSVSEGF